EGHSGKQNIQHPTSNVQHPMGALREDSRGVDACVLECGSALPLFNERPRCSIDSTKRCRLSKRRSTAALQNARAPSDTQLLIVADRELAVMTAGPHFSTGTSNCGGAGVGVVGAEENFVLTVISR